jgi:hypothetical protein
MQVLKLKFIWFLAGLATFGVEIGLAGVLSFLSFKESLTVSGDEIKILCIGASIIISFSSQFAHKANLRKYLFPGKK